MGGSMERSQTNNLMSRIRIYQGLINLLDNSLTHGIAVALTIVAFYLFLFPFLPKIALTESDLTTIGNFIEWFGVPYGLLLALVLVNVWTEFESTDRAFDREVDTIYALYNTFLLIADAKTKKYVYLCLYCYIEHVIANCKVEPKVQALKLRGDKLLNHIRKLTGRLVVQKKEYEVLTTELLRLVNKLIDFRGDRLSFSKQRMPKPVLYLSFISSALWLVPFFALSFGVPFVRIPYLVGVIFVIVSLLLIVMDLDEPFNGTWHINLDTWNEMLGKIKIY
jgi:hypothetical protein